LPEIPSIRRLTGGAPGRRGIARAPLRLAGALAVVASLALAGCGSGGGSGTSVDPATVVPASAPVYAGADVRPSGSEESDALAAGRALTGQADPYKRLVQALQTPGSPALDYDRDVAPWLGPHAGLFLSSVDSAAALLPLLQRGLLGSGGAAGAFPFAAKGSEGALVLDTKDVAKARSFLSTQASHAGAHATTYRGTSYEVSPAGVAFAIVQKLVVVGSDTAVHGVIDTSLGGSALVHAPPYSKLLSQAPAGTVAHLYTNASAAAEAGSQQAGGTLALLSGSRAANVSLVPAASSLSVYADAVTSASTSTPGGLLTSAAQGSQAFDELPGDSWLALGLGDVGPALGRDVGALSALASAVGGLAGAEPSSGTISIAGLLGGLLAPLRAIAANSAQARADFTSWMGSGGVFASGSGLFELKGAVVIESKDPAKSRAAVGKLAAQLRRAGDSVQPASIAGTDAAVGVRVQGVPLSLYVANGTSSSGKTKFVLALGEPAVTEALSPQSTLASAESRTQAASALGEGLQPSLVFQVPTLVSLLEGVGLSEDPTLSPVLPYARALSSISGGGHSLGGEVERFKVVVALQKRSG
jgi:hypothetical protein